MIYLKLTFDEKDKFTVFINNNYMDFDTTKSSLYDSLKKILLLLRKRYAISIYGYFETNIYNIENIGTILKFKKIDEDNFDIKNIDLKINIHDCRPFLKFSDYFLIKNYKNVISKDGFYYLSVNDILKEDIVRFSDFYDIEILC